MTTLKLWLDDVRPAPEGWLRARSVNEAIDLVRRHTGRGWESASLDHDLGDFADDGGDGWRFVLWMVENDRWPENRPNVHSMNPVGVARMRADIANYFPRNRC